MVDEGERAARELQVDLDEEESRARSLGEVDSAEMASDMHEADEVAEPLQLHMATSTAKWLARRSPCACAPEKTMAPALLQILHGMSGLLVSGCGRCMRQR